MARPLSTMHPILRTDLTLHTKLVFARSMSSIRQVFSLRNVTTIRQNSRIAFPNFSLFQRDFNPFLVHFLSGIKRECTAKLSTLTCYFRLLEKDVCNRTVSADKSSNDVRLYRDTYFCSPAPPSFNSSFLIPARRKPTKVCFQSVQCFLCFASRFIHILKTGYKTNALYLREVPVLSEYVCISSGDVSSISLSSTIHTPSSLFDPNSFSPTVCSFV